MNNRDIQNKIDGLTGRLRNPKLPARDYKLILEERTRWRDKLTSTRATMKFKKT